MDFDAEISVFGFAFLSFDWAIRKNGFEKLFLRTAVLHAHSQLAKKKTAVHESSFANPFSDFPIER